MGLEKAGLKLITAWAKTSEKSLLATKPLKVNIEGLRLAPKLEGDVVNFSKKEIVLEESFFDFLPWRKGLKQLPPTRTPQEYTAEAKEATERFMQTNWIEEPLPNGFRMASNAGKVLDDNGLQILSRRNGECCFYREDAPLIKQMLEKLSKVFSENPNLTEEQKAKTLYNFVNSCYDRKRINWVEQFNQGFIDISHTAVSGAGICRHMSFLTKILGDKIGLKIGMARGEFCLPNTDFPEPHMWNEIVIKGKKYLMDVALGRFGDIAKMPEYSSLYYKYGRIY